MPRHAIRIALILAAGAVAACGPTAGTVLVGGSLATFVNTDKTVADHIASAATGDDCSTLRLTEGGDYCQPETDPEMEAMKAAEQHPYCYRTLGKITCYDTPDPYNENSLPVR